MATEEKKEKKDEVLFLRVNPALKSQIAEAASMNRRSIQEQCIFMIEDYLMEHGTKRLTK